MAFFAADVHRLARYTVPMGDVYDVFRHVSLLGAVVNRTCICFLLLAFVGWTAGW